VHKLVTNDNAFIDARFNYEKSLEQVWIHEKYCCRSPVLVAFCWTETYFLVVLLSTHTRAQDSQFVFVKRSMLQRLPLHRAIMNLLGGLTRRMLWRILRNG